MSTILDLDFGGFKLDGLADADSHTAVKESFDWPTPTLNREWIDKRVGSVAAPNPRTEKFELSIPLQFQGTESQIKADAGTILAICRRAESLAHLGGVDLTAKLRSETDTTTLQVIAGDLSEVKIDFNRLHGVGSATLKLVCEPQLLGAWATIKQGRKPAGVYAQEVQIGSVPGDLPGPCRVTLTNQGSVGQQFAMLGLDGRGYASGNNLVLKPSTFDYSTAPLNGSYTAPTNEVQTATKSGTISGGSFTLTYEGQTTTSLAHNASTATVKAALEALPTIGTGNINVTGTTLNAGNMVFTFQGALAGVDAALIVLNSSLTGGGSAPITQTTQGASGYVSNTSLQSSWSDFMRTSAQTDTGSFQLWALVETSATAGQCRVRAMISTGDPSRGVINRAASVAAKSAPIWVNLGPVHAKKRVSSGGYQWTATLSAMTLGTTGTYCRIRRLAKVPIANGVGVVRVVSADSYSINFEDTGTSLSGAINGDALTGGGTWTSGGDSDDFSASSNQMQRTAVSDTPAVGRYAYSGGIQTSSRSRAYINVQSAASISDIATTKTGPMVRFNTSNGNMVMATINPTAKSGNYIIRGKIAIYMRVGGSWSLLVEGVEIPITEYIGGNGLTLNAYPNGMVEAYSYRSPSEVIRVYDAAIATGGTLETGRDGVYDEWPIAGAGTRQLYWPRSLSVALADNAIHPSRKLAWQPDGTLEREAPGGTVFAYAAGQQRAGQPMLQPDAGEGSVNRLLVASAQMNPDYGSASEVPVPLDYLIEHRPAYAIGVH